MTNSLNHPQVIFIGIAGPTGSGKTTCATHLIDYFYSPLYPITLDHFYIRGIPINHPILGRVLNEEVPETLSIEGLLTLLRQIKNEPERITQYHRKDISIKDHKYIFVIVEGFLLFALSDELTNMFDIRIFFESTQSQCRLRRYRRRCKIEETIPDDQIQISDGFQQWFDHLVWNEYLKRRDLQISKAEKVFQSDEFQNRQYTTLDNYIDKRLKDIIDQKTKINN
jgi:uridine kinase